MVAVCLRHGSGFFMMHRGVVQLTVKNRLPVIGTANAWVDAGGLMSYGQTPTLVTAALPYT
jgi:hypothetical protein